MKKQFAVFGLGKFGHSVALELENSGCEVVVVDKSMEKIQEISDLVTYAMRADIEDPVVMKSLGARNLDGAIVAIAEDMEASILATILSKEAGIPYVLAKANTDLHASILEKVGADVVVFPEREMGGRIAKGLAYKKFTDWIDISPNYSIVETKVPEAWVGKSLRELKLTEKRGINVVGLMNGEEVQVVIDPDEPFRKESIAILLGSNEALKKYKGN